MMMGVAQVMGMKPILRSVFSSLPFSAASALAAPIGNSVEIAAIAVPAPTARRKLRRSWSSGKRPRITADSTTRDTRASSFCMSASWSAWLWWRPQLQPARCSLVSGSNGLSKPDMGRSYRIEKG